MPDTLFVQFLSHSKRGYWDLANGFSDTWDICRRRGDFHWVVHEADSSRWYSEEIYAERVLPVSRGTVYVSAVYINHLYQAYAWARRYPDIQFVVGGPVAAERGPAGGKWDPLYFRMRDNAEMPENLGITGQSMEQILGVPEFSGTWRLEIPSLLVDRENPVYFSYTLDNGCYWGKCIYCNIKEAPREFFRKRESVDFEFSELRHPGKKIVRLNTGSVTPAYIREVFSTLPARDDLEYRTFMRSAGPENKALEEVLSRRGTGFPSMTLGIGVEFPSDRMLKYMGKGITTGDILETLSICAKSGIRANGNVIFGWNNLTEDDLLDMERFFEQMPEGSMTTAQLRWLYAHPNTSIHEQYRGEPIFLGPFYLGFVTEITGRQLALNGEAVRIIKKYSREKNFRIEGMANMKAGAD